MMRWRTWWRISNISVYGAPVYVHWSVLAAVAIVGLLSFSSPLYAAVAIVCYLSVIGIHELGHVYAARRLGYDVVAVRVAFLHGVCECEAPRTRWDEVLVAWGGVVAQLLVAVPVLLIAATLGTRDLFYFGPVVAFLGYVNLLIALVNLALARNLDGSVAWQVVPLLLKRFRARRGTARSVVRLSKRK
jgi:membrane-associated protease RseP (regulator of RpoE activity)